MQTGLAWGESVSGEDSEESIKKKKTVMTTVMQEDSRLNEVKQNLGENQPRVKK